MSEQATDLNSADKQGANRAAAMAEQGVAESAATEDGGAKKAGYEKAEFDGLTSQPVGKGAGEANLDVILDIPVTLSMEIGRTEITINDLLQLGQGSVVELERLAGEPMDVMVNGTLIAHGEVVVVDEKFGIRLTDVISPTERIKKLK
jgi:flagellar motor switch protein FliN/FliY